MCPWFHAFCTKIPASTSVVIVPFQVFPVMLPSNWSALGKCNEPKPAGYLTTSSYSNLLEEFQELNETDCTSSTVIDQKPEEKFVLKKAYPHSGIIV